MSNNDTKNITSVVAQAAVICSFLCAAAACMYIQLLHFILLLLYEFLHCFYINAGSSQNSISLRCLVHDWCSVQSFLMSYKSSQVLH